MEATETIKAGWGAEMVLTFRSSQPEIFELTRVDSEGRRTVATGTRTGNTDQWTVNLSHPGGQSWSRHVYGPNIIDHLGEMFVSKESTYRDAKARGFRPRQEPYDKNVPVDEMGNVQRANIVMNQRDSRYRGR
jgi:hypothetical protein